MSVDVRSVIAPTLAFGNPADRVVDFGCTARNVALMARGSLEVITDSEAAHNLFGPLAPSTVELCTKKAVAFVRGALEREAYEAASKGSG